MTANHDLLILDYGGVYSFEYDLAAYDRIMMDTFGKIPSESEDVEISHSSRLLAAGKITVESFVETVSSILGLAKPANVEAFKDNTISVTFEPSQEMVALVKEVRSRGIKVALLSDMYDFEAKTTRPWGRFDGFDYVSLSAEIGATKAETEAFIHTLQHFDIPPEATLFVDDKKSNIDTAESLAIDCLWANKTHYTNADSLIADIRKKIFGTKI